MKKDLIHSIKLKFIRNTTEKFFEANIAIFVFLNCSILVFLDLPMLKEDRIGYLGKS